MIAMQGRVHYYEGYSLEEVTFPIRVFKLLGIKRLILTNAAGGIDIELSQGALMVISDHLNLMGVNPLRGPNDERFGPRFPDMSEAYSRDLQQQAVEVARTLGIEIRRGIYAALVGSQLRDARRNSYVARLRRRCGGNEHGSGNYRGAPDGH